MNLSESDKAVLKGVYQRLADEPLQPGSPFYEKVYERPEGEDPIAKLRTRIEWTPVESLQLFSGFRGAGKTTELFRLRRDLETKGYMVLYADALEYLSPSDEVDVATTLLSVAGAFGEQLERVARGSPLRESFWQRIGGYLRNTSIQVDEVSMKLEGGSPGKEILGDLKAGLDLKVALRSAPTFRQRLHEFLANRLGELKAEVNAFVEAGVQRLREATPEISIVFIFDQFEQVRGSRANEQAVIHSVERLFANHAHMLKLPYVHTIYTVPPWLQVALPGAFSIEMLPCVRLWNNDDGRSRHETGMTLLRDAIGKRFGPALDRVFGGVDRVDRLVGMSGGHFRDLLRLFRETIVLIETWRPSLPVATEVLDRAIANVRNEYLPIADEDAQWLAKIARGRTHALCDLSPERIGRLSRFLDTHLVLYLANGEAWYDVHPLIRNEVEKSTRGAAATGEVLK